MTRRLAAWMTALTVIAALALPGRAAAQHQKSAPYPYILIDLGTFGGPFGSLDGPGLPITPQGIVLGTADTTIPDSDYPNFNPFMGQDPYIRHAFAWHKGVLTDLGALPGNNSSAVFEVNNSGVGTGMSETPTIDPYTGWPSDNAVVFKNGQVINLGTLPGGYESQACCITDRGQVAGFASNGTPDPFSMFGWGTQARSVVWQDGVLQDIGTLGGPDAVLTIMNARGQITGQSYTNATPNAATGIPTMDPFLWQEGTMRDLGSLGGTVGVANWLNNRGDVVGQSDLVGDQTAHPFLWNGSRLVDLGTLGGSFGSANYIDEAGDIVGFSTPPGDQPVHAVLWKNGAVRDLGVPPGATFSFANVINTAGQILGGAGSCSSGDCDVHPFLWQDGAVSDLNTLVAPSALLVTEGVYIDERGAIAGLGVLNGNQHVILLVPAGLAASQGLTSNAPAAGTIRAAAPSSATAARCPAGVFGYRMCHTCPARGPDVLRLPALCTCAWGARRRQARPDQPYLHPVAVP